jgi:RNA polymerase sigma-70 factor (ECF subfamily)
MRNIPKASDDELLHWASAGDEEAFLTLYRRRQGGIYRFALHMSGNATIAEEVTQEVFLTVIREGSRFDVTRGTAAGFLFGVARNHVLRLLEKEGQFVPLDDHVDLGESVPDMMPGPLLELTQTEMVTAVREAVLTLPAPYREVVALCDLQEVSYADAALVLAIPVGTVRSRLSRGRGLLFEKLKSSGNYRTGGNAERATAARAAGTSHE